MTTAIIDKDPKTLEFLNLKYKNVGQFVALDFQKNHDLQTIAKKASEGNFDAIAINIESTFEGAKRTDLKGIDLIFWLRIKYQFTGPIITYGFLSSAQVLRLKPQSVVIHAPGNLHWRLPDDFNTVHKLWPKNLKKDKIFRVYEKFIKKFIDQDELRHFKANWWGIKTLWDIDNLSKRQRIGNDYPQFVKTQLAKLNNYLFCEYHFRQNEFSINDLIDTIKQDYKRSENNKKEQKKQRKQKLKLLKVKQNETIENLKGELEEYHELVSICEDQILDAKTLDQELKKYDSSNYEESTYNLKILELENEKLNYENEIKNIENQLAKLSDENISFNATDDQLDNNQFDWQDYELEALENNQTDDNKPSKTKKILLIDDMADLGWLELYKNFFPDSTFISLEEIDWSKADLENLKIAVKQAISNQKPDAIILDLRLLQSDNTTKGHHDLTGFKILEFLKTEVPQLPVLITSASNKIWSFQESIAIGAVGYFMKEGLDNLFSKEESIANYLSLKKAVNSFDDELVVKKSKIAETLLKLTNSSDTFWWQDKKWENLYYAKKAKSSNPSNVGKIQNSHKHLKLDKEFVCSRLDVVSRNINSLIKQKQILGKNTDINQNFNRAFIQQIASIIEKIHHPSTIHQTRYTVGDVLQSRGDFIGLSLYRFRNNIIHNKTEHNQKENKDFDWFFNNSLKYLTYSYLIDDKYFKQNQKLIEKKFNKEVEERKILKAQKSKPKEDQKVIVTNNDVNNDISQDLPKINDTKIDKFKDESTQTLTTQSQEKLKLDSTKKEKTVHESPEKEVLKDLENEAKIIKQEQKVKHPAKSNQPSRKNHSNPKTQKSFLTRLLDKIRNWFSQN